MVLFDVAIELAQTVLYATTLWALEVDAGVKVIAEMPPKIGMALNNCVANLAHEGAIDHFPLVFPHKIFKAESL